MKKFKHLFWIVAIVIIQFSGIAQEKSTKVEIENVATSFSVEINADTTLKDLEFIKKLLKEDFNTTVTFGNMKFVDDKIVALKLKVLNDNQSYVKSVSGTTPISPFTITLKETGDQQYRIIVDQNALKNHTGLM